MSPSPIDPVHGPPHEERLRHMIEDAQLLRSFAVRSGKGLPDNFHSNFAAAVGVLNDRLEGGAPAAAPAADPLPERESAFLKLCDELAVAMAPVSAQSIRYTLRANAQRVFWPTVLATIWAVVVFLIIVNLQGYWAVGKRFVDLVNKQSAEREALFVRSGVIDDNVARLNRRSEAPPSVEECKEAGSRKPKPAEATESRELAKRCAQAEQNREQIDDELNRLRLEQRPPIDREINKLADLSAPVITVLNDLYALQRPLSRIVFFWRASTTDWDARFHEEKKEIEKERANRTAAIEKARSDAVSNAVDAQRAAQQASPFPRWFAERQKVMFANQELKSIEERAKAKIAVIEERRSRGLIHRIVIALDILQSYVIPALMGLLGALVFVLRDLGTRLRNYAYVPDSLAHGVGRVVVGTIAGVLAGWLLPSTDSIAKSIPPLVIPFMFGYSVEVLFRLLDKTIDKLSPV